MVHEFVDNALDYILGIKSSKHVDSPKIVALRKSLMLQKLTVPRTTV